MDSSTDEESAEDEPEMDVTAAGALHSPSVAPPDYENAHLLSVPIEIRDRVREFIHQSILEFRLVSWTRSPKSAFDGWQLTCKQIHAEHQSRGMLYAINQHNLPRLLKVPRNKFTYFNTRSLSIQIALDIPNSQCLGLVSVLHDFQLSLQELQLSFVGADKDGRALSIHGCGMHARTFGREEDQPLSWKAQHTTDHQLSVLLQLQILRNLRVLVVKNPNLPLTQSMLITNKPHLQALSVTSDPRSILHLYRHLPKSSLLKLALYKSPQPHQLPPVKALDIGINATLTSWRIALQLQPNLEHLSWTVPPPDFQESLPARERSDLEFYSKTAILIESLSWRAPKLTTLRMCLGTNKHTEGRRRNIGAIQGAFEATLPQFPSLRKFELHHTQSDHYNNFMNIAVSAVQNLPKQLRRLYISDDAIDAKRLIDLIAEKYLGASDDNPLSEQGIRDVDSDPVTEQVRTDHIPLDAGHLGFVTFTFKDDGSAQSEAIRHSLLRLNGLLLDREHNMHLLGRTNSDAYYGIPPRLMTATARAAADRLTGPFGETSSTSDHMDIALGLYKMVNLSPHPMEVAQNCKELDWCLPDLDPSSPHLTVEEIFRNEHIHPAAQQSCKPGIDIVDVPPSNKCLWMSPDYEVPPVGESPPPTLPADWRQDVGTDRVVVGPD